MKRFTILLLIAAMLLASCGTPAAGGEDTTGSPDTTLAPETTAAPETTKAPAFVVEDSILGINRTPKYNDKFMDDKIKASAAEKKYIASTADGYTYISVEESHFDISGLPFNDVNSKKFYRLEYANNSKYSTQLQNLAYHTAGVRIRFKTDATSIDVQIAHQKTEHFAHMPKTAVQGIDVYVGSGKNPVWVDNYSAGGKFTLPAGTKDVTIVLPLYSGVRKVVVGIPSNSSISSPSPYEIEDPVVYYGSSITQGACASRPGMSYPDITTRMLGANLVNLGFSSGALGETIVAETIAKIKMSAFVYDYDHNGSVDNLRDTHYNFYKIIRQAQPNVPIIMISRFSLGYSASDAEISQRRAIIKATYDKAVAEGDTNVYFIDGADVYPEQYRDFCLVDGIHPNDLGMYFVANAIYPVLKDALTKAGYIK